MSAWGIHAHNHFKTGKAEAKKDHGAPAFSAFLRVVLPILPVVYDFDAEHPGVPTPMFANDTYGCCVMAGRAHQTLRFELLEQGKVLAIADADVTREYFKETGGKDAGLVVADSLKLWKSRGWTAAGNTYKIKSFAAINIANHDEVRQAIYSDVGVGIGVQLPISAQGQIDRNEIWTVTHGPNAVRGGWGGHYVFVVGYNPTGPICITWGRKQQMTWAWFAKYCDEAFAIFDAKDSFKMSMIDSRKLLGEAA